MAVPSRVQNVEAIGGAGEIKIVWDAPESDGGSPITNYRIWIPRTTLTGNPPYDAVLVAPTARSYTRTGYTYPTGSTRYYPRVIDVRAVNADGTSTFVDVAVSVRIVNDDLSPVGTDAPRNVTAVAGNGQIAVAWHWPQDNGGRPIERYGIEWRLSSSSGAWSAHNITSATPRSYTITGLTNGQSYDVRVRADNRASGTSWSSYSPTASATPSVNPTAPGVPRNLSITPGTNQLSVSWDAPTSDGGSAITGYTLLYRPHNSGWFSVPRTASQRSYTLTGLTASNYDFRVAAVNAIDTGAYTSIVSTMPTAANTPGMPSGLSLSVTNRNIVATWTVPTATGGSPITGYIIYWRRSGSLDWASARQDTTATAYTITNLATGTWDVEVAARNANGVGARTPQQTISNAGTAPLPPDPVLPVVVNFDSPPILTAIGTHNSLDCAFVNPVNTGGHSIDLRQYRYRVSGSSSYGSWRIAPGLTGISSFTISNLLTGTSYDIQARVRNSNGDYSPVAEIINQRVYQGQYPRDDFWEGVSLYLPVTAARISGDFLKQESNNTYNTRHPRYNKTLRWGSRSRAIDEIFWNASGFDKRSPGFGDAYEISETSRRLWASMLSWLQNEDKAFYFIHDKFRYYRESFHDAGSDRRRIGWAKDEQSPGGQPRPAELRNGDPFLLVIADPKPMPLVENLPTRVVPEPPPHPILRQIGNTIEITMLPSVNPGTRAVLNYDISYGAVGRSRTTVSNLAGPTHILPNLSYGESYVVAVYARNQVGRSGIGPDSRIRLYHKPNVPGAPRLVTGETSLRFYIDEPISESPVIGYEYQWKRTSDVTYGSAVGIDYQAGILDGLLENTSYDMRVRAVSIVDKSDWSTPSTASTAASMQIVVPDEPRIWLDVYDANGGRIGDGPIVTVISASVTRRLDGIPNFSITMSLADPRTIILVQAERRVQLYTFWYGITRLAIHGIIRQIQINDDTDTPSITISGPGIIEELKRRNVLVGRIFRYASLATLAQNLIALVPGWSVIVDRDLVHQFVDIRFDGTSVLKAFQSLYEHYGIHIRQHKSGQKVLEVGKFGNRSGFRMSRTEYLPASDWNRTILPVRRIEEGQNTEGIFNRIYIQGAGEGVNALSLQKSSRTRPYPIYSALNPDGSLLYFIQDDDSIARYGVIEKLVQWKNIAALSNSDIDLENAANALYDAAVQYLIRHKDTLASYTVDLLPMNQTALPGDTISMDYEASIQIGDTNANFLSVLGDYWITEISENIDSSGITASAVIKNTDRPTLTAGQVISNAIEKIEMRDLKPSVSSSVHVMPFAGDINNVRPINVELEFTDAIFEVQRVRMYLRTKSFRSNIRGSAAGGGSSVSSNSAGSHRHKMFDWKSNAPLYGTGRYVFYAPSIFSAPRNASGAIRDSVGQGIKIERLHFNSHLVGPQSGPTNQDDLYTHDADGSHSHNINVPSHTHELQYGIFDDSTFPAGVTVRLNGVDVTNALFGQSRIGTTGSGTSVIHDGGNLRNLLANASGGVRQRHQFLIECRSGRGHIEGWFEIYQTVQAIRLHDVAESVEREAPAPTVPAAPSGLEVLMSQTTLYASWRPPLSNGNSPITGYIFEYKLDTDTLFTRVSTTDRVAYITGLTPAQNYDIRVLATNIIGESAPTAIETVFTADALPPASDGLAPPDLPDPTALTIRGQPVTIRGQSVNIRKPPPSQTAPGVPQNLTLELLMITTVPSATATIRASWSDPVSDGGNALINYIIRYRIYRSQDWTSRTISTLPRYYDIAGLSIGQIYEVQVAAVNLVDAGSFTDETALRVAPRVPDRPANFQAVVSSTSAALSWLPPITDGGSPITGYKTGYRLPADASFTIQDHQASDRSASLTGLSATSTYIFAVAAVNDIGQSDWEIFPNVQGVVRDLEVSITDLIATVKWRPPVGVPPVSGYVIGYKLSSVTAYTVTSLYMTDPSLDPADSGKLVATLPPGSPSARLSAGSTYDFSAAVSDHTGQGAWATPVRAEAIAVPGSPMNLEISKDLQTIVLAWDPPSSIGGGPITGYMAGYKLAANTSYNVFEEGANARAHYFPIPASGIYDFTVAAVNDGGQSAWATAVQITI